MSPRMSHWALRQAVPPHPKAAVSSPLTAPFGYLGRAPLWCPTPRRHPLLASGLETPVRWVIIIEIWYNLSNRARGNKQIGRTLPVIRAKAPRATNCAPSGQTGAQEPHQPADKPARAVEIGMIGNG